MNASTSLSNLTPADFRTIFSMTPSYHERDTPGHVVLWITGYGTNFGRLKFRIRSVQPHRQRGCGWCSESLVERRRGICEAQPAVALSWWAVESPGLPFAKRCQAGRLASGMPTIPRGMAVSRRNSPPKAENTGPGGKTASPVSGKRAGLVERSNMAGVGCDARDWSTSPGPAVSQS